MGARKPKLVCMSIYTRRLDGRCGQCGLNLKLVVFRAGGVDRSKREEASISRFAYAVSVDSFGAVAGQPR